MTPRPAGGPSACPECGGPLPHEAIRFCVSCGASLPAAVDPPATVDPPDGTGGGRGRRWRLGPVIAVAAVLGLSAGATGALLAQEHAPARQTAAGLRAASAAERQLAGFTPALRQSAAAHTDALRATRGVADCRMAPTTAIGLMYRAIIRRQRALDRLGHLPLTAVPHGSQLATDLRAALREAIAADQDVIGWMQDVQDSSCPVSPQSDLSFQAGLRAAARASTAQRSFLARWNPVARRYGQPALSQGQL